MKKAILDTNVFNRLCDGRITLSDLPSNAQFVVTKIQRAELNATRDKVRKQKLNAVIDNLSPDDVPAESFCLDVDGAGLDEANFNHDPHVLEMKRDLDNCNKGKCNNIQDALIVEVALLNKYILVTADQALADVAEKHGVCVKRIE